MPFYPLHGHCQDQKSWCWLTIHAAARPPRFSQIEAPESRRLWTKFDPGRHEYANLGGLRGCGQSPAEVAGHKTERWPAHDAGHRSATPSHPRWQPPSPEQGGAAQRSSRPQQVRPAGRSVFPLSTKGTEISLSRDTPPQRGHATASPARTITSNVASQSRQRYS